MPQVFGGDDLVGPHVNLHVPAEIVHSLRQRLDHVDRRSGGVGIELGEADAANSSIRQGLQLGLRDRRVNDGHSARLGTELSDGVEGDAVIGNIDGRRDDDGPGSADPLLQQAVLGHTRVHLQARARPKRRETFGIIDMHVAVAGICRCLELRRLGAGGVRHGVLRIGFLRPKGACCRPGGDPAFEKVSAIHRVGVHGASSRSGSRESFGRDLARTGSRSSCILRAGDLYVCNPGPVAGVPPFRPTPCYVRPCRFVCRTDHD